MPQRRRPLKKPKAAIGYLANENTPPQANSRVGTEVIERVKKCFARANHDTANEQEAKAASRMAAKIMEQYSISQADIMMNENSLQREKRGGISTVDVRPAEGGGRAFTPGWVEWVSSAMQRFFDCRAYSTGHDDRIEWTFYGIAEHTVSAAIAFEAIHNQIQDWSEKFTGIPIRNSYCLGVADGLLKLSEDEKKAAEAQARKSEAKALAARLREEELDEQRRLAKLRDRSLETISENDAETGMDTDSTDCPNTNGFEGAEDATDDVSDNEVLPDFTEKDHRELPAVDTEADFETELRKFAPSDSQQDATQKHRRRTDYVISDDGDDILPSTEAPGDETVAANGNAEWKDMRQLSTFREMSHEIEENVLKTNNVKLSKARKKPLVVKDRDAFKEGQKDSRKIEVRAARIEPSETDGPEDMDLS